MKFGQELLDDIKSRLHISSVIGRSVAWDRRKSNPAKGDYWACCPFHGEKTPSFHVDDRKGRYHCFGCKASGDAFTFLVEKEGLSFPEAVERLALEAGLELPKSSQEDAEQGERRKSLYDVVELATDYYRRNLESREGEKALAYLRRRGIKDATIKEFLIGYAPDSRSALRSHLAENGVTLDQMVAAGLVVAGPEVPAAYDRFRDRIMFPIQDQKGRVIAFGGRAMSDDAMAKYLNSPETELFDKGNVLYNLHRARKPAFDSGKVILVEGYMDVIALFQEGIQHVTAALGTALTESHLRQLWRMAPEPVLCFDGDKAGYLAASRALDRAMPLLTPGHSLRFMFPSDGKDPADLMLERRQQEFLDGVEKATPAADYFFDREISALPIDTPEQKAALESRVRLAIGAIADNTVRRHYELRSRIVLSDLFWTKDRTRFSKVTKRNSIRIPAKPQLEEILLGMAVECPDIAVDDLGFQRWSFEREGLDIFHSQLVRLLVDDEGITVDKIYQQLDDQFYLILEIVHGHANAEKKLPRGHALYRRMPIMRHHPSREFVRKLFNLLQKNVELHELARDRDGALERFEQTWSLEDEARLIELVRVIEMTRTSISEMEKEMEDEAAMYSEIALTSRMNTRSAA